MPSEIKNVAIGGLGAIGLRTAEAIDAGIEGLKLSAVSARNVEAAEKRVLNFRNPPPVVAITDLAEHADIIVECLPAAHFDDIAFT